MNIPHFKSIYLPLEVQVIYIKKTNIFLRLKMINKFGIEGMFLSVINDVYNNYS